MSFDTHDRAALNPQDRLKLVRLVLNDGWAQARGAERFQVARSAVFPMGGRCRAGGHNSSVIRSSELRQV